jgi:HSP20 family protein
MVRRSTYHVSSSGPQRAGSRLWRRMWLTTDHPSADRYGWKPPTNVYETPHGGVVQVEVAGLSPGACRVSFADGVLTITGVRHPYRSETAMACHRMEIASGRFSTQAAIPWPVRRDAISVTYLDGLLEITLPRATS